MPSTIASTTSGARMQAGSDVGSSFPSGIVNTGGLLAVTPFGVGFLVFVILLLYWYRRVL